MEREPFKGSAIAGLEAFDQVFADERDDLRGDFEVCAAIAFVEFHGVERHGEMLTAGLETFAGNDAAVGCDEEINGFAAEAQIAFWSTAEDIATADLEGGFVVDQFIAGGSAPSGADG